MKHESEFQTPKPRDPQAAREMAATYARVLMGSEDGKRVLSDLRAKFGLNRLVFVRGENGRYDTLAAAITEGERRVMSEIENALKLGSINSNP